MIIRAVVALLLAGPAFAGEYETAVQRFSAYRESKRPGIKNDDNLPFLLTTGAKAKRSVLMIHGLTDSPYYMRTLADTFHAAGYNVVAVLLPGHGTKPQDLLDVRLEQWRSDVALGVRLAGLLGDEVSLAGFSTGGALALDVIARRDEPIKGLFLFSPAFEAASDLAGPACFLGIKKYKKWVDDVVPEDHPHRYRNMALNSGCQLHELTESNRNRMTSIKKALARSGTSVFTVMSGADKTVKPMPVRAFMQGLPKEVWRDFVWYPAALKVAHAAVTRPETNRFYADLETRLKAMIAPAPAPAVSLAPSSTGAASPTLRALLDGVRFE